MINPSHLLVPGSYREATGESFNQVMIRDARRMINSGDVHCSNKQSIIN